MMFLNRFKKKKTEVAGCREYFVWADVQPEIKFTMR